MTLMWNEFSVTSSEQQKPMPVFLSLKFFVGDSLVSSGAFDRHLFSLENICAGLSDMTAVAIVIKSG